MSASRAVLIDVSRGIAIALMVIYHFCYDLVLFGWQDFALRQDSFWIGFRVLIVSLFLLLVGISLQLAHNPNFQLNKFKRRLTFLVISALLVSIGSYFLFHQRFIYFGILHFIVIASVISVWFRHYHYLNLGLGVIFILIGNYLQHSLFNSYALNWMGFTTEIPATEDYVPLFPWLGVVFIGLFVGNWLKQQPKILYCLPANKITQPLSRLGQHGLLIYLLHQPLLFGLFMLTHYFTSNFSL